MMMANSLSGNQGLDCGELQPVMGLDYVLDWTRIQWYTGLGSTSTGTRRAQWSSPMYPFWATTNSKYSKTHGQYTP